jgi:hypothetical protein
VGGRADAGYIKIKANLSLQAKLDLKLGLSLATILCEGNVDNEPTPLEIEEETDKIRLDNEVNDSSKTIGNYYDNDDSNYGDDTEMSKDVSDNEITDVKIVNTQTTTDKFSEDTSKVTQPIEKNKQRRNVSSGYDQYGIKYTEEDNRKEVLMICDLCEKDYETVNVLKKHREKFMELEEMKKE